MQFDKSNKPGLNVLQHKEEQANQIHQNCHQVDPQQQPILAKFSTNCKKKNIKLLKDIYIFVNKFNIKYLNLILPDLQQVKGHWNFPCLQKSIYCHPICHIGFVLTGH